MLSRLLLSCLFGGCVASGALAQGPTAPPPLSLSTVLRQVEQRHPKLLGGEAERRAAAAKRVAKEGAFDPVVSVGYDRLRYNSSSSRGKASTTSGADLSVELPTESGIKFETVFQRNFGAVKSPDSSTGSAGSVGVLVKLPLLRGAGVNPKAIQLQQARLGEPLADQGFALVRQSTLLDAALVYWEWVGAVRRREVAAALLRVARDRLALFEQELIQKQRALVEVTEAAAQVSQREASLVKADRDLTKAALKLRTYLFAPDGSSDPTPLPQDLPEDALAEPAAMEPVPQSDRLAERKARATTVRPETLALGLQIRTIELEEKLARNDLQPNVDLVYGPGRDIGARGIGDTLKAGIAVTFPTYFRDARGRADEARLKRQKLEQELNLARVRIEQEVDDTANAVEQARLRWIAARSAYEGFREVERVELVRFKEGDSDLLRVNLRELATFEALNRVIETLVEYHQARAAYLAAAMEL